MSKKPALGSNYISANMRRFHADWSNPVTYMPEYNYKKALPRFYKDKIFSKPLKLKIKEQLLHDDLIRQDQVLAEIRKSAIEAVNRAFPPNSGMSDLDRAKGAAEF